MCKLCWDSSLHLRTFYQCKVTTYSVLTYLSLSVEDDPFDEKVVGTMYVTVVDFCVSLQHSVSEVVKHLLNINVDDTLKFVRGYFCQ